MSQKQPPAYAAGEASSPGDATVDPPVDRHGAAAVDAATPADRDRWVDTLRVGSLLVVVLGHWLMVAVTPDGRITNALAVVPALQPLT